MADTIPPAAGNGSLLVKPSSWEAMRKKIEEMEIIPDPEEFETSRRKGKLFFRLKKRVTDALSGRGLKKRQFDVFDFALEEETWYLKIRKGYVLSINPLPEGEEEVMKYWPVTGTVLPTETTKHAVTAGDKVYVKVTTNLRDIVTAAEIVVDSTTLTNTHAQPDPSGEPGLYYYKIAEIEDEDGTPVLGIQYHIGGPITHRPGRNNRNLKVIIEQRFISYDPCDGLVVTKGDDEFIFFRQGLYVGVTDPGLADGQSQDIKVFSRITNPPTSTEA